MRLIDADALPISVGWMEQGSKQEHCAFVFERDIKDAPTVDAVEVVRCADCKYLDESLAVGSWDGACKYWKTHSTAYSWFCSKGERREVTE